MARRTRTLRVRMTPKELKTLEVQAKKASLPVSILVRQRLFPQEPTS